MMCLEIVDILFGKSGGKKNYTWEQRYGIRPRSNEQAQGNRRLRAELKRVTEERDILKKTTVYFAKDTLLSTSFSRRKVILVLYVT